MKTITIRFYEELNDFLPPVSKKRSFKHSFQNSPSIKDIIESLRVPHSEIDLIIVNMISVDFSYQPSDSDYISVYPVFESVDISPILHLHEFPLRKTRFIVDVNLGKLTKYLRLLGFDSLYKNDYSDKQITEISINQERIILTRDIGLLKRKQVNRGYWVRSAIPKEQIREIVQRFDLKNRINSFTRCLVCNGIITVVGKTTIIDQLLPNTKKYFTQFYQCTNCKKIYWRGSHYDNMIKHIQQWIA